MDEITQDELQALQEKAKKAEELETALKKKEEELSKLSEKEMNFSAFRKKNDEEKKAIMEKMNSKERMLLSEIEAMRNEKDAEEKAKLDKRRAELLEMYAGNDEDYRKALELEEQGFAGEVKSVEDLDKRFAKAVMLAPNPKTPQASPLHQPYTGSGYTPERAPKKLTEKPEGKELYKAMFGHFPGELGKK